MPDFTLTIHLGNDAMQSPEDVAGALSDLAESLAEGRDYTSGPLRDVNGNTVGTFAAEWPA